MSDVPGFKKDVLMDPKELAQLEELYKGRLTENARLNKALKEIAPDVQYWTRVVRRPFLTGCGDGSGEGGDDGDGDDQRRSVALADFPQDLNLSVPLNGCEFKRLGRDQMSRPTRHASNT